MENSDKTLAVYLEYDGANKNEKNWCCQVKAQFKIFQQNGGGNHVKREIEGFYHKDSHISRGIDILNWRDVFGGGYYINSDDAIVIEVEFSFQFYDFSRKEAGFTDFTVPMYNTIKNDDYAKFIELAKKLNCLSLHQRCEHFLIQNQQVKLIDKFKYAQDNDYELLMVKCIDSNANQKFARRSEIRGVERCDKVENYESAFGLFLNDFE
ncbi:unnamed protein product [Caenorhabditis angaria]|uniref:MATH domain-containing protein n=1 Tax=Caenorhabditis angaria TaxID=860376 RepID=A0A9P1I850_9PELO|nr:unnamed protein product [Caenorhabditis angaria]